MGNRLTNAESGFWRQWGRWQRQQSSQKKDTEMSKREKDLRELLQSPNAVYLTATGWKNIRALSIEDHAACVTTLRFYIGISQDEAEQLLRRCRDEQG